MLLALVVASQFIVASSAISSIAPFLLSKQDFSLAEQQQGRWSNMSVIFHDMLDERHLFSRQSRRCVDSGYIPCPNVEGCCPAGNTCYQNGCCPYGQAQCSGNTCYDPQTENCCNNGRACPKGRDCVQGGCCPTGQQPCGSSHCYDPAKEQCCKDAERGCEKDLTCCGQECCSKYATCNNGHCEGNTCITTTTYSITSFATKVVTVTKIREPEGEKEAPEFTCVPMTATDAAGDTLELGDDCGLTFEPADAGPTTSSLGPAMTPTSTPRIKPRAPQADDTCLYTDTNTVTYTVNTITTTTTTVTRDPPSQEFSCLPMSVTNDAGDELSLDEECKLEFSPGDSPAAAATAPAINGDELPGPTSHGIRLPVTPGCALISAVLIQTLIIYCT